MEQWKPVVGYEGWYSISSRGIVRRDVGGRNTHAGRLRKALIIKDYACVQLSRDGIRKTVTVHSLVMAAFVGARPSGMEINHKNGIKTDNRLENLEYVTPFENQSHAYRIGLKRRVGATLTEGDVCRIKAALAQGERQCDLARRFGIGIEGMRHIAHGRTWRHVA